MTMAQILQMNGDVFLAIFTHIPRRFIDPRAKNEKRENTLYFTHINRSTFIAYNAITVR
jgi:hypothetical protein